MFSSLLLNIPIILAGLLLLVSVVTIYLRSKNVTKSEFFKLFKTARLISTKILIFVVILTGLFGVLNHIKAKNSLRAVVALNYSEASQAHNSNGTRYNMAEIICDEVIEKAIERGALEDVTVKQLKDCLRVYPYVQGAVDEESHYLISTEFVVEYHTSKHTDHLDSENVITLIAGAYKEYYIEKYTDNFSLRIDEEKPDFSKMEYMDIVSYFNKETNSVLNYLYGLADKAPSFVMQNNTTFHAIAEKVYRFKETQIDQNLMSLVLQYGIARNKSNYIDRLSYQNENIDFDRRKNQASFELCNETIDMYSEEMTRVVLVPTWDESGKYYMGRTKVGIDELSVMATAFSNNVSSFEKEITNNNFVIDKMESASGNKDATVKADELIIAIDEGIDDFTTEAINAGREYSNYTMNQCIAVTISGTSLFDELKTIVLFAVLAYASALLFTISRKFPKVG